MNQSQIHPALRQSSLSTSSTHKPSQYSEVTSSGYSPIQPSPNGSHQTQYYASDQQLQDSPDDTSPGPNPADPNDLKRPRACEACRQLKVKCELDEGSSTGSCKRCARAHRQCIVTVPSRKRQKKTDSRVAELERKIDALTATLAAKGGSQRDPVLDPAITHDRSAPQHPPAYMDEDWQPQIQQQQHQQQQQQQHQSCFESPDTLTAGLKRKHDIIAGYGIGDGFKPTSAAFRPTPPLPQFHATYSESRQKPETDEAPYIDVIDRNIIDITTARRCFDRYNSEMSQQLPVVVFPPDQTADVVRKTKPVLFLAVLAVASGTIQPDLQAKLTNETTRILGDRVIYNGEKSMELVQTIQLMTIFYQPPERYEELNFNQLIHIAAVMAMDIGMGKRSKKGPYPVWKTHMEKIKTSTASNSAEIRRCWLGCYYMCTNSAMSLRRPLLVRWSPYTEECVQILSTAEDALPSDKLLCHLVKAQHIGENIGVEFSMDDPASVLSIADSKTQRHLKVFEQNLETWREAGADLLNNPIVKHTEAIINLYMHEIAMHHDHNIDDFRPPYNTAPIAGPPDPDSVTPAHTESITACLQSAHNAFEAFLSMDITILRALPTHFFVRNSYAAVALIKLYSALAAKGSKFGTIFDKDELKVDYYLDRIIQTLHKIADGGMSKVAHKFIMIFSMLKKWHLRQTETPPNEMSSREDSHSYARSGSSNRQHKDSREFPPDTSHAWSDKSSTNAKGSSPSAGTRNGLQMLSDAAMQPNRSTPSQVTQGQWVTPPGINQPQAMSGIDTMNLPHQDYNMMQGGFIAPGTALGMGGYTSDDFMAFGLGDDWASLGFAQDAPWAY